MRRCQIPGTPCCREACASGESPFGIRRDIVLQSLPTICWRIALSSAADVLTKSVESLTREFECGVDPLPAAFDIVLGLAVRVDIEPVFSHRVDDEIGDLCPA